MFWTAYVFIRLRVTLAQNSKTNNRKKKPYWKVIKRDKKKILTNPELP